MKNKRKIVSAGLVFTLICMCLLFSSCGGPTEDEIISIVSEKVAASLTLNVIYFGEGLPANENSGMSDDGYRYVDVDASYSNIEDIRAATAEVFTPGYCEALFEGAFIGYTDDNDNVICPRYTTDYIGWLMVYEDYEAMELSRSYLYDTISIDSVSGKSFTVTIETEINGMPDQAVNLSFLLHEGEWLLDTPTY